jgi:hypothetical protein
MGELRTHAPQRRLRYLMTSSALAMPAAWQAKRFDLQWESKTSSQSETLCRSLTLRQ